MLIATHEGHFVVQGYTMDLLLLTSPMGYTITTALFLTCILRPLWIRLDAYKVLVATTVFYISLAQLSPQVY